MKHEFVSLHRDPISSNRRDPAPASYVVPPVNPVKAPSLKMVSRIHPYSGVRKDRVQEAYYR
jgi:hypothetical protein